MSQEHKQKCQLHQGIRPIAKPPNKYESDDFTYLFFSCCCCWDDDSLIMSAQHRAVSLH